MQGPLNFEAWLLDVKSFRVFFAARLILLQAFLPAHTPPCFHGKYVVSIVCFYCFLSVSVPGGC